LSTEKKVAVAVCTGMDQALGTVSRYAGYHVLEKLRPDKTVLLCTPALIGGVQEDVDFAKNNPVLVIDGCRERCCEKTVNQAEGKVRAVINVEDVLKQHEDLQPESRVKLGPKGMKLAEIVGQIAAEKVDEILVEANKLGQ
jgi:uncharacterized metal-binding protein